MIIAISYVMFFNYPCWMQINLILSYMLFTLRYVGSGHNYGLTNGHWILVNTCTYYRIFRKYMYYLSEARNTYLLKILRNRDLHVFHGFTDFPCNTYKSDGF